MVEKELEISYLGSNIPRLYSKRSPMMKLVSSNAAIDETIRKSAMSLSIYIKEAVN